MNIHKLLQNLSPRNLLPECPLGRSQARHTRYFLLLMLLLAVTIICSAFIPRPMHQNFVRQRIVSTEFTAGMERQHPVKTGNSVIEATTVPTISSYQGTVSAQPATADFFSRKSTTKAVKSFLSINRKDNSLTMTTANGPVTIPQLQQTILPPSLTETQKITVNMFAETQKANAPVSFLAGELFSDHAIPLRWNENTTEFLQTLDNVCPVQTAYPAKGLQRFLQLSVAQNSASKTPRTYLTSIQNYAQKYNLAAALILAIMHTESNFNHLAVSSSNALGLMQVIPQTAGSDVHAYLTGVRQQPTEDLLLKPETNIQYGTTYLYLLNNNYFKGITDATSRQLCVIAAYNGGPNAVLRVFDSDKDTAISKINELSQEEVYTHLTTLMPTAQARKYVAVVMDRYYNYASTENLQ